MLAPGVAAGLLLLQTAGVPLDGPPVTAFACLSLLVFGLPHGALDLEIIRRRRFAAGPAVALALYLVFGAAMYALWLINGVLALSAFLLISIRHFSEDWEDLSSPFLATGAAVALLSAPALLHHDALGSIFASLAGDQRAGILADLLLLCAPLALAVAAAAIVAQWRSGDRAAASSTVMMLTGMAVLPPVVGFSCFFCLSHSPRHFRHGLAALGWRRFEHWSPTVLPLVCASFGLALLVDRLGEQPDGLARALSASFETLSILTLPHMAVPALLKGWTARSDARRRASCQ